MTTTGKMIATAALVMTSLSCWSSAGAASPDRSQGDYFGRSTGPAAPARPQSRPIPVGIQHNVVRPTPWVGPRPAVSQMSTPTQWFEAVDEYVGFFRPSNADRVVLDQPFNEEVERVEEFCRTIAKISRNYRTLAKRLTGLPIPNNLPEARQYRDLNAAWYSDQALLYEDMVRPRKPARTKEELDGLMKDLRDKSEQLASQFTSLQLMDTEVRKKHNVHSARYDDALRDYTMQGLPDHIKKQIDGAGQH